MICVFCVDSDFKDTDCGCAVGWSDPSALGTAVRAGDCSSSQSAAGSDASVLPLAGKALLGVLLLKTQVTQKLQMYHLITMFVLDPYDFHLWNTKC